MNEKTEQPITKYKKEYAAYKIVCTGYDVNDADNKNLIEFNINSKDIIKLGDVIPVKLSDNNIHYIRVENCSYNIIDNNTKKNYPQEEQDVRFPEGSRRFRMNPVIESAQTSEKMNDYKRDKLKKIIIPISAIVAVGIIVVVIINIIGMNLNEDEQLAYENAVQMRDMMKDPDSFKLYDEMFLLKHNVDGDDTASIYTIFEYGGTNEYGAMIKDEAIFQDGEFIMTRYGDADDDDVDKVLARYNLSQYSMFDDNWEKVEIDVDKIKRKMKLD